MGSRRIKNDGGSAKTKNPVGNLFIVGEAFFSGLPAKAQYGSGSGTAEDPYQIGVSCKAACLPIIDRNRNQHVNCYR